MIWFTYCLSLFVVWVGVGWCYSLALGGGFAVLVCGWHIGCSCVCCFGLVGLRACLGVRLYCSC